MTDLTLFVGLDVHKKTISVALYRLGSAYEKLGQSAKAAETFDSFLQKHGNDELAGWAHYQAGVALESSQDLQRPVGGGSDGSRSSGGAPCRPPSGLRRGRAALLAGASLPSR